MTNDTNPNLPAPYEAPAETPAFEPQSVTRTNPAAESLAKVGEFYSRQVTAADMAQSLQAALLLDRDGEAVLFNHAQVLDSLFHRLVTQSLGHTNYKGEYIADSIDTTRLSLALQTQRLCRVAIESMGAVRENKKLEIKTWK